MKIKKPVVKTTTNNSVKANVAKKVKAAQPTSPVPAVAKAQPTSDGARAGVNIGKTTGLRVMAFQDATLSSNDSVKRPAPLAHIPTRLTDTELAKVWRDEFPNSRAVLAGRITEEIVRGVRNLYNRGTGGHGTPGKTQESKPFTLDGKTRVETVYTRARKAQAEPAPVVTPAKAKGPAVVATPKGKVVVARRKAKAA